MSNPNDKEHLEMEKVEKVLILFEGAVQVDSSSSSTEEEEEEKTEIVEERIKTIMMTIPNIIDPSVPIGKDDSENVEVERFGEPVVPSSGPISTTPASDEVI